MKTGSLYKIVPNRRRFTNRNNSALFVESDGKRYPISTNSMSLELVRRMGLGVKIEYGSIILILKEFRHNINEYLALYKNKKIVVCRADLEEI